MEDQFKLGRELKSVLNLLCRKMECEHLCKDTSGLLSATQLWVIEYLYENRRIEVLQRDLEQTLGVRRSTVTGILQGLERRGLIRREADSQDARMKKLFLTPKAIQMHELQRNHSKALGSLVTSGISAAEWEGFYIVLEKMKGNLK